MGRGDLVPGPATWTVVAVETSKTVKVTWSRLGGADDVQELTPTEAVRLGYDLISAGRIKAGLDPL